MFKNILIWIVIAGVAVWVGWKFLVRDVVGPKLTIGDNTFTVEVADTPEKRAQGLSGHEPLSRNHGMIFIFESPDLYGFWMKDMLFPLDLIWIHNGKVIGIDEDLPPDNSANPRVYYPPGAVNWVLEVQSGTARSREIGVGDTVTFTP